MVVLMTSSAVHPAHLAFVLINEGSSEAAAGPQTGGSAPLFSSVIQRAGGDPVSTLYLEYFVLTTHVLYNRP